MNLGGIFSGVGAGVGQAVESWRKQQDDQLRQLQLRAYLTSQQEALKEKQESNQSLALAWPALLGGDGGAGGGAGGIAPLSGGGALGLPGATPTVDMSSGSPAPYSPSGSGQFSSGLRRLTEMGINPEVASGFIGYMDRNENGGKSLAVNPSSGALGRAQWLGPRKAALTSEYGQQPSDDQQADFMAQELSGPERRVYDRLKSARTGKEGYDIAGRDYERPGSAALAKAGVGSGGLPPEIQQQVQKAAQDTARITDPVVHGRMSLSGLAQQIDKANPGASPVVKMMALQHVAKLLAPGEREQFQMYMQQNRLEFGAALKEMAANQRVSAAEQKAGQGGQIFEADGKFYRAAPDGTVSQVELPQGAQKVGAGAAGKASKNITVTGPDGAQVWTGAATKTPQGWKDDATGKLITPPEGGTIQLAGAARSTAGALDESQAKFWAQVIASGGSLPPGLRRSGIVEQVMKQVPGLGTISPGDFIAKHSEVLANTGSLRNMTKMADAAISFEKLAEKNFDVALKMAPDAVPTDLGPFFNRWIEEGEKMLGDPSVPAYVASIITGANEYAKVMSGSTGTAASTVDSRREARDMFSPYLSLPQISQVIAVAKADMKNRENTLNEQVSAINSRISGKPAAAPAPPAMPQRTTPSAYASPEDVLKAIDSGALTPDKGKKILIDQFGFKPAGPPA